VTPVARPTVRGRVVAMTLAGALLTGGCGWARADYIRDHGADALAPAATSDEEGGLPPRSIGPGQLPPDPSQAGIQLDTFFGASGVGMFNADVSGFYEAEAVEVGFIPGTPDEDPIALASAPDGPEFLLASLPAVLKAREEHGSDLVLIAQLFQRSGMLLVAPSGTPLDPLTKLKKKPIGLLTIAGRSLPVEAALASAGLHRDQDYETVDGYDAIFDPTAVPITGLMSTGAAKAVQATSYDEYGQLLEFGPPDGGDPYTADRLTVRDLDATGDGLLGPGIFARASWLAEPKNRETAVRFLRATFKGYADCVDHLADCAQEMVDQGAALPVGHQTWSVNEVDSLIWPAPGGIGTLADGAYVATVRRLLDTGLLRSDPSQTPLDLSIADDARSTSQGVDLVRAGFVKASVPITPGGEGTDPVVTPPPDEGVDESPSPDAS
jgi:NitT/TauT family transport system substrate-binding protein